MDLIKYDMTDIWAAAGDVVAPDSAKVRAGWGVEVVPRQWWNWFENRQDNNIAYMLQKGFPEWDATTEYQINKSYVQRNGTVYKATATSTNSDPTALTSWVKVFADYSVASNALATLTPAANQLPYFDSTTTSTTTPLTAFARTILDDVDAPTVRTTINAQTLNTNLTALSGVTAATNGLPYFTSTTAMGITNLTGFARSILNAADAPAVRLLLDVPQNSDLTAGLATRQPLDATLTALAGLATSSNTLPYFTGVDVVTTTPLTAFARTILDDADATTVRATIGLNNVDNTSDVNKPVSTATQTALDGKQPLDATLTAVAGVTTAADTMIYFTAADVAASATLTAFARSMLDDPDAATARTTLNAVGQTGATGAALIPLGADATRPGSPTNGMFRYNTDSNQFEGYQNGSWGTIGGGSAIFSVDWWPGARAAVPAGYVVADGQTLSRTAFPTAWTGIAAANVPVVADALWISDPTRRGCFSQGDGTTTFRVPDYNGKFSGSLGAVFQRGDGGLSSGTIGTIQTDALQNITGPLSSRSGGGSLGPLLGGGAGSPFTTTSLATGAAGVPTVPATGANANADITTFDASRVVRTATETRPLNVTGVWIIKLFGAGVNAGVTDITALATQVATNKAAIDQGVLNHNYAINSRFDFAQRGATITSPSAPALAQYTLDQMISCSVSSAAHTFTVTQAVAGTVDFPLINNSTYYYRFKTNTFPGAVAGAFQAHKIAVEDARKFAGQRVTFSVYLRSNTNRTCALNVLRSLPSVDFQTGQVINVTTNWQRFSLTFDMPLLTTAPTGIGYLAFSVINYKSDNATFSAPSGAVGALPLANDTLDIACTQIELGELKSYSYGQESDEFVRCLRYLQVLPFDLVFYAPVVNAQQQLTTSFLSPMRVTPVYTLLVAGTLVNVASAQFVPRSTTGGYYVAAGNAVGQVQYSGGVFSLSAEI